MANDEKNNAGDGGGAGGRSRRITPAFFLPTPEETVRHLARLQLTLRRIGELCADAERIVREGGIDHRSRAFLRDLADVFETEVSPITAGTGRALRRLAESK